MKFHRNYSTPVNVRTNSFDVISFFISLLSTEKHKNEEQKKRPSAKTSSTSTPPPLAFSFPAVKFATIKVAKKRGRPKKNSLESRQRTNQHNSNLKTPLQLRENGHQGNLGFHDLSSDNHTEEDVRRHKLVHTPDRSSPLLVSGHSLESSLREEANRSRNSESLVYPADQSPTVPAVQFETRCWNTTEDISPLASAEKIEESNHLVETKKADLLSAACAPEHTLDLYDQAQRSCSAQVVPCGELPSLGGDTSFQAIANSDQFPTPPDTCSSLEPCVEDEPFLRGEEGCVLFNDTDFQKKEESIRLEHLLDVLGKIEIELYLREREREREREKERESWGAKWKESGGRERGRVKRRTRVEREWKEERNERERHS